MYICAGFAAAEEEAKPHAAAAEEEAKPHAAAGTLHTLVNPENRHQPALASTSSTESGHSPQAGHQHRLAASGSPQQQGQQPQDASVRSVQSGTSAQSSNAAPSHEGPPAQGAPAPVLQQEDGRQQQGLAFRNRAASGLVGQPSQPQTQQHQSQVAQYQSELPQNPAQAPQQPPQDSQHQPLNVEPQHLQSPTQEGRTAVLVPSSTGSAPDAAPASALLTPVAKEPTVLQEPGSQIRESPGQGSSQTRQVSSAEPIQALQQPYSHSPMAQQQANADFAQGSGLQGMLGRGTPDVEDEASESEVSVRDRQKFMQSLHSPDKASKGKGLAKGFGRMKARAKDLMQSGSQAGAPSAQEGGAEPGVSNAGPSRGSRMARDVTMMFGGLKRPTNQ